MDQPPGTSFLRPPSARFAAALEPLRDGNIPDIQAVRYEDRNGTYRIAVERRRGDDIIVLDKGNRLEVRVGGRSVLVGTPK